MFYFLHTIFLINKLNHLFSNKSSIGYARNQDTDIKEYFISHIESGIQLPHIYHIQAESNILEINIHILNLFHFLISFICKAIHHKAQREL